MTSSQSTPHPRSSWVSADRQERVERHQQLATAPATECEVDLQGDRQPGLIIDLDDGAPSLLLLLYPRCSCSDPACLCIMLTLWLDRDRAQVADLTGAHVTEVELRPFGVVVINAGSFRAAVEARDTPEDPWWPTEAELEVAMALDTNPAVQAWRAAHPSQVAAATEPAAAESSPRVFGTWEELADTWDEVLAEHGSNASLTVIDWQSRHWFFGVDYKDDPFLCRLGDEYVEGPEPPLVEVAALPAAAFPVGVLVTVDHEQAVVAAVQAQRSGQRP
jgi:hypothetical protein